MHAHFAYIKIQVFFNSHDLLSSTTGEETGYYGTE